jgi:phosphatidylserine/phosphatidylglycerophosphate/cardiolipin synthase-like enzyme
MRRRTVIALVLLILGFALFWVGVASAQDDESLADLVARVGKTRWTDDNRIELLADPRRAWEARLDLLESASSHIYISTFSWYEDDYGTRFRDALADLVRSRRAKFKDFEARCLADATGMKMFTRAFNSVRTGGARVRSYNRIPWGMAPIYDARMHDKMLISDGRAAIVGGRNYSDIYFDPQHWWLDFGVLVEGAAVWDIQMIFLKAWVASSGLVGARNFGASTESIERRFRSLWSTGRYPNGKSPLEEYFNERYFPVSPEPPGDTDVAVLYDNSMIWDRAPTAELLVELVRRANEEIDIMTPFTNFESVLTDALIDAARRGVRVRIITNDRDAALRGGWIRLAAFPTIIRLVNGGVQVWAWRADPEVIREVVATECGPSLMPPVALHGKVARFDDELTIVHSSNFNIRSTYYNTEAGLAILDSGFNRRMRELFDGLLTLRRFDLDCTNGERQMLADQLVTLLGEDDTEAMRIELGGRQRFLDGMSMLW